MPNTMKKPLSLEKPVFRCFLFYAGLINDRTLLMKILTMNNRVAHAVGHNTAPSIAVGITDDKQLRAHAYFLWGVSLSTYVICINIVRFVQIFVNTEDAAEFSDDKGQPVTADERVERIKRVTQSKQVAHCHPLMVRQAPR